MTDPTTAETTRVTPDLDRGGVILHLPEITYLDTQVWSVDVGLTDAGLGTLRIALASSAAVSPPVDRAALRDRIRRAICEAEGFAWDSDMLEPDEYGDVADAVLAVLPAPAAECRQCGDTGACNGGPCPLTPALPAPADRAAVLTEAADALEALDPVEAALAGQHAWRDAAALLRRLAGGAAPNTGTETRERCPDCQMPHDLTPSVALACASIRASIRDTADGGKSRG